MLQSKKGFTLIELLVVIAIISILAAVLFPVYTSARARGNQIKCLSNLKQLATAAQMYADDNDGGLPSSCPNYGLPDWCGCSRVSDPAPKLYNGSLWKYTSKAKGLYVCPTDRGVAAPQAGNVRNYPLSYTMNDNLHYRKMDSVRGRISRVLFFIHEARSTINDGNFNWGSRYDIPGDVHWDGTTAVYLDGHARWANQKTLLAERDAGWWDPDAVK